VCSGQLSLLLSAGLEMSSSYGYGMKAAVCLIGKMLCLLAAPWVQLSVSAGNGWPHNALRHHWLMPISCHFRDCKALLVTSLTHISGAITSVQNFTLDCGWLWKELVVHSRCSKWCPFAFTHARSCALHWSTALSMMLCRMLPWHGIGLNASFPSFPFRAKYSK